VADTSYPKASNQVLVNWTRLRTPEASFLGITSGTPRGHSWQSAQSQAASPWREPPSNQQSVPGSLRVLGPVDRLAITRQIEGDLGLWAQLHAVLLWEEVLGLSRQVAHPIEGVGQLLEI